MNNNPVQRVALGKHGLISYQADPKEEYRWLLHESYDWFTKAREIHGPEWKYYDDDDDPVTYKFDSLGFRSDYEVEDLNGDWVLCSTECIGVGPGVHNKDLYHKILEERHGIPFYNASTYGGRVENVPFNLLQLSKYWKTPPKHIILLGSQNSTGISVGVPGVPVGVKNIDYIPAAYELGGIAGEKKKDLLFLYQSLGVAKWQHMIMMKTIIRLAENWGIPILWIDITSDTLEDMSSESTYNSIDDSELHIVHHFTHGVGVSLPTDPDSCLRVMSETVLKPMREKVPPPGASLDDVGRDLLHPGAKHHKTLADKIEFELTDAGNRTINQFWYA